MEIIEKLRSVGFSEELAGTKYLAGCIRLCSDSGGRIPFTEIYVLLSDRYGKSASSVMKAVKYAIDKAVLAKGREDFLGGLVRENGSVTAKEFVSEFCARFAC